MTHMISHWWWWFTGARNEAGSTYGIWSGFGGAVPDIMIVVAFAGFLWHRNCHVRRCWRLGRHHVEGTPYVTCRRHHPAIPGKVTAGDVTEAHEAAKPAKPRTRTSRS